MSAFSIATWNVNSLKVRLGHLLDWLAARRPDVVCLQETKTEDAGFPAAEIEAAGYRWLHAGQRTYNGVAILSREAAAPVSRGIPGFEDAQQRLVAADVRGLRVVCAYFPNGQSVDSDKYQYKLKWISALQEWLAGTLTGGRDLVLAGDFNIAPEPRDVHDPGQWEGQVLFSDPERAAFRQLVELGLKDSFRLFDQPERQYTWWDYRMNAFRRNLGLRIDHILVSASLAGRCRACEIDASLRRLERPSDHAPVIATLEL